MKIVSEITGPTHCINLLSRPFPSLALSLIPRQAAGRHHRQKSSPVDHRERELVYRIIRSATSKHRLVVLHECKGIIASRAPPRLDEGNRAAGASSATANLVSCSSLPRPQRAGLIYSVGACVSLHPPRAHRGGCRFDNNSRRY